MDAKEARYTMIREQLLPRHIRDERVLRALARVPRQEFIAPEVRGQAYTDNALPIAAGQTISQPYIVALMAQALKLDGTERVLEVGCGSGYAAAVLGELAAEVISVERHAELAASAAATLHRLGYTNVSVQHGDGSHGWPAAAPFAAISVPAGAPKLPAALVQQLESGGRLVIPVGPADAQRLVLVTRQRDGVQTVDLGPVRFVPLIGAGGWAKPSTD